MENFDDDDELSWGNSFDSDEDDFEPLIPLREMDQCDAEARDIVLRIQSTIEASRIKDDERQKVEPRHSFLL